MNYQILDLETYKRKSHFEYFSQLAYPYVGVTADVDITKFHAKIKEQRLPFFLSFCYCAAFPRLFALCAKDAGGGKARRIDCGKRGRHAGFFLHFHAALDFIFRIDSAGADPR